MPAVDPLVPHGEGSLETGANQAIVNHQSYDKLKTALRNKFGEKSIIDKAVTALEAEPDFKPNRNTLAGRIEQVQASADSDLLKLAGDLTAALQKTAEGRAVLAKYQVNIQNSEVGVVGDHTRVEGGIHFGDK